jgi:hypothetical protein
MANMKDWHLGQLVTQGELDDAFADLENADLALASDWGLRGVTDGLEVTAQTVPNLTVRLSPGTAYDQLGRRILLGGVTNVDIAPYLPAGAGASKIVSVCIRFDRLLSDPRLDDNSVTVYFSRAESFQIFVEEGAEVVGTPAAPSKPADGLVLADIELAEGMTQITNAEISADYGRRDWAFEFSTGTLPDLQVGTLREVVGDNRQILDSHISDLGFPHAAESIGFDNGVIGLPGAPDNIQDAIDELFQGSGGVQVQNEWTFDLPITIGSAQILYGAVDPSDGAGVAAPIGSLYLASDGVAGAAYIKTGAADTAWSQVTV